MRHAAAKADVLPIEPGRVPPPDPLNSRARPDEPSPLGQLTKAMLDVALEGDYNHVSYWPEVLPARQWRCNVLETQATIYTIVSHRGGVSCPALISSLLKPP
jgi:hypothetical protein